MIPVMTDLSFAQQRFCQIVQQPGFSLAEAALYIAQEEYPELNVETCLSQLTEMVQEIRWRLPSQHYPLRIIQAINHYLYDELGFSGNAVDYYDPRNSFLNDVLERRTGIPITLSLIYLEIAQQLGLPMVGVGMPGHFLVRPVVDEMDLYVDPFYRGEILFYQDCQDRLAQIFGPGAELQSDFLEPVNPHQLLRRLLSNLKHIYLQKNQVYKCLATIERILMVFPQASVEIRDRGILYYQLGYWPEARQDLETYLSSQPQVEDIPLIYRLLSRMEDRP
jgi:regulator of sirC expression with transglutaminase-like and TPR domain